MREILEEHVNMTISEAARRMKVSRPALYSVLNGTAAVTADMALRFARLTGGAPELYLNMQVGRDLEVAQQRLQNELADIEPGPRHHPPAAISTSEGLSQRVQDASLSDATLRAVQAYGEGATASDVMNYLTREFGMTVRPNHLRVALHRHGRAGRVEHRGERWYSSRVEAAERSGDARSKRG
jgi:antitoxin HigA-1